jgi:glycosyltransferase involved in cell wall biosynthesis
MARLLFDVTRLAWRARRNAPTGIDRVLLAYADWLGEQADHQVVPVALAGNRLVPVPMRRYRRLLAQATTVRQADVQSLDEAWSALMQALNGATPTAIRRPLPATRKSDWLPIGSDLAKRLAAGLSPTVEGDLYLNVAHSGLEVSGLLSGLASRGVAPVIMVHDIIPITHPEFCAPGAEARHRQRIDNVLRSARLVIANSESTAASLAGYAERRGVAEPVTVVAPLGIEPTFAPRAETPATAPYFLAVGTLEARKNLAFLLMLWRRLADQLGPDAPHLVLVGRRGWENESLLDQLERAPGLGRLVHEIADVSDARLAQLMAGATAMLAPSLAEGFDLPALEALAVGTPLICSDIDVHRELAAGATLVDPLDGPGWLTSITRLLGAPRTRRPVQPPGWSQHFARVSDALRVIEHAAAKG